MTLQSAADVFVLLALFAFLVIVIWLFNPGGFLAWCREEWRLARAETWANGVYQGTAGTARDPRVAKMVVRQRALGKRMRRLGRSLLSDKQYIPALTKAAEPPPPKADKVVAIKRPVSVTRKEAA